LEDPLGLGGGVARRHHGAVVVHANLAGQDQQRAVAQVQAGDVLEAVAERRRHADRVVEGQFHGRATPSRVFVTSTARSADWSGTWARARAVAPASGAAAGPSWRRARARSLAASATGKLAPVAV